ncbi:MAG: hypothetical protein V7637_6138 [Mycobacteriales bacterium]|jgi:hypothetical protein
MSTASRQRVSIAGAVRGAAERGPRGNVERALRAERFRGVQRSERGGEQ